MTQNQAWHPVCQADDLHDGTAIEFTLEDTPCFAFALSGVVAAYVNRCPHLGIELNWMPERFFDIERMFIQCATHGALFTPDQGICIVGPCQGEALTPLECVVSSGVIQVRMPE